MKLYFAPGACSLADHIALHEAGLRFDRVQVDLKSHRTETGGDYSLINPKGYVPALQFDDGSVLTENIAILSWIGDQAPGLVPHGPMGRYRLLEMLAFISTELHKSFKPFFQPDAGEAAKTQAREQIEKRLSWLADRHQSDFLLGDAMSVADAYLFVMLTWARKNAIALPEPLRGFFRRMMDRPAVKLALDEEQLEPAGT